MDGIDTTGKALVAHWAWAAEKGLMNSNTASALRAACSQVMAALDDWETIDVRTVDPEDVFRRFQNKRSKDFKPDSFQAYKRRFLQAVRSFLEYANDPASWKAPSSERAPSGKREKRATNGTPAAAIDASEDLFAEAGTRSSGPSAAGLVEYPFPLREGRLAYLRLPADLKAAEVRRLTAFLGTLAVDAE
jgi:hypothetical protein